jgi:hypothetical protein
MTRTSMVSAGAGGKLWAAVAAVLAAAALTACGSSQTQTTSSAPAASGGSSSTAATSTGAGSPASTAQACSGSQLALSYGGTQGATGHLELTIAVRNASDHPCRLRGYPEARLLDRSGHALPLRVSRGHGFFPDTMPAPAIVTLAPHASAHFGISFVTNNEYAGAHVCRTATAAMSAAPGTASHWQLVSLRSAPKIAPCGNRLVVSPVHA